MDPLITSLLRPEAYDHPVETVRLLETHISWVLLAGEYAYKIKKPVDLGFVNFSTGERRQRGCEEELRLNRRLAPDLYIGLSTIHGPRQRASFIGPGQPIEVAVKMHRFPQRDLLPDVLARGDPDPGLFEQLAETLAAFHSNAAVAPGSGPFGTPEKVLQPAAINLEVLLEELDSSDPHCGTLAHLHRWTQREHQRLQRTLADRLQQGRIRECHGDLHLGNMVLHHGRIEVFDCLEFNAQLRWIDVISDMAFLAMDLQQRGYPVPATGLMNRWLETSGDYLGLRTWRWYQVYRALVRAKVTVLRRSQCRSGGQAAPGETGELESDLQRYLQFAMGAIQPPRPVLAITRGISGSGKTHLALALCRRLGWIHLRSDVERKRLFDQWGWPAPGQVSLDGDPYRPEITAQIYDILGAAAAATLGAGFSVVVDATFLNLQQRRRMQGLAGRLDAGFCILDCHVPVELARRRLLARRRIGADPSDADETVLDRQVVTGEPLSEQERIQSCLLYTSPSPRDQRGSRMPSSA